MVKTARATLIVIVGMVGLCAMVFLFWVAQPDQPAHLKIVNRTFEQGKPVVFFRIDGEHSRHFRIAYVEKVKFGGATERPFESARPVNDFWAPSQSLPLDDERRSREPFGVIEPSNEEGWKLRVWVSVQNPGNVRSLREIGVLWRVARSKGQSFFEAARFAGRFYFSTPSRAAETRIIESDRITNAVAIAERGAV